jgi:hypothetical protein
MCKKDFTERFILNFWNYDLLLDSAYGFQNFKKKIDLMTIGQYS